MLIKCLVVGPIETNCYIVTDEESLDCAVIDPGADASAILEYLEDNHLRCRAILLTHGHYDHTGALDSLLKETGAPLWLSRNDDGVTIGGEYYRFHAPENSIFIKEGDSIHVGSLCFTVLETPGHTPGSLTFLCRQEKAAGPSPAQDGPDGQGGDVPALFTGDTLFRNSCGRTDFPGSSTDDMLRSLRRLASLPGDYEVYPGHMEASTLERERRHNLFMDQAMRMA